MLTLTEQQIIPALPRKEGEPEYSPVRRIFSYQTDKVEFYLYQNDSLLFSEIPYKDTSVGEGFSPTLEGGVQGLNFDLENTLLRNDIPDGNYKARWNVIRNYATDFVILAVDGNKLTISDSRGDRKQNSKIAELINKRLTSDEFVFPVCIRSGNSFFRISTVYIDENQNVFLTTSDNSNLVRNTKIDIIEWVADPLEISFSWTAPIKTPVKKVLRGANSNPVQISKYLRSDNGFMSLSNIESNTETLSENISSTDYDFTDFSNFVHLGKAKLLVTVAVSKIDWFRRIPSIDKNKIPDHFTDYERYILSIYPKDSSGNLLPITDNTVLSWLGSDDVSNPNYGGLLLSAFDFDIQNKHSLTKLLPDYIKNNPEADPLIKFVSLMGNFFDMFWVQSKNLPKRYQATHTKTGTSSLKYLLDEWIGNWISTNNDELIRRIWHHVGYWRTHKYKKGYYRSIQNVLSLPKSLWENRLENYKINTQEKVWYEGYSKLTTETITLNSSTKFIECRRYGSEIIGELFRINTSTINFTINQSSTTLSWKRSDSSNNLGSISLASVKEAWLYIGTKKDTQNTTVYLKWVRDGEIIKEHTIIFNTTGLTITSIYVVNSLSLQSYREWSDFLTDDEMIASACHPNMILASFRLTPIVNNPLGADGVKPTNYLYHAEVVGYPVKESMHPNDRIVIEDRFDPSTLYPLVKIFNPPVKLVGIGGLFGRDLTKSRNSYYRYHIPLSSLKRAKNDIEYRNQLAYNWKFSGSDKISPWDLPTQSKTEELPVGPNTRTWLSLENGYLDTYDNTVGELTVNVAPSAYIRIENIKPRASKGKISKGINSIHFKPKGALVLSFDDNKFNDIYHEFIHRNRINSAPFINGKNDENEYVVAQWATRFAVVSGVTGSAVNPDWIEVRLRSLHEETGKIYELSDLNRQWASVGHMFPAGKNAVYSSWKELPEVLPHGTYRVALSGFRYLPYYYWKEGEKTSGFSSSNRESKFLFVANEKNTRSIKNLTEVYDIFSNVPNNLGNYYSAGSLSEKRYSTFTIPETAVWNIQSAITLNIKNTNFDAKVKYRLRVYLNSITEKTVLAEGILLYQPTILSYDINGVPIYQEPKVIKNMLPMYSSNMTFSNTISRYFAYENTSIGVGKIPYDESVIWNIERTYQDLGKTYYVFKSSHGYLTPPLELYVTPALSLYLVDTFIDRISQDISVSLSPINAVSSNTINKPTGNISNKVGTVINNAGSVSINAKKNDKIIIVFEQLEAVAVDNLEVNIISGGFIKFQENIEGALILSGPISNSSGFNIGLDAIIGSFAGKNYKFKTISNDMRDKYGSVSLKFNPTAGDWISLYTIDTGEHFLRQILDIQLDIYGNLQLFLNQALPSNVTPNNIGELGLFRLFKNETTVYIETDISNPRNDYGYLMPENLHPRISDQINDIISDISQKLPKN